MGMNRIKEPVDQKKLLGTIVGIILFLGCALFFTYAWYEWRSEETNVDLVIQEEAQMTCNPGPNVNVQNIGPVLSLVDGVKADFTVSNNGQESADFALYLDITSISVSLLVPSFKYALVVDATGGDNYDYQVPVLEGNFTAFGVGSNTISTTISAAGGSVSAYRFIVYIDGNMPNEESMMEGSMMAVLSFGDCSSTVSSKKVFSDHIMSLYHDGSALTTVNIGGDTTKPTVSQNGTQSILLDNNGEYRYYGASPKNYVKFNGELWRIIGVSNVKTNEADTKGSMRVKIMRNGSVLESSELWDTHMRSSEDMGGINDWSIATLNTELNDFYYHQTSGGNCGYYDKDEEGNFVLDDSGEYVYVKEACDFTTVGLNSESRGMFGDALWYLGSVSTSDASDESANIFYDAERSTNAYDCVIDDGACPRSTSWTGKVGLVYASDYIYASDRAYQSNSGGSYSNWMDTTMLYGYFWTITSVLLNDSINIYPNVFAVQNSGFIAMWANIQYGVNPTVYLNADVLVTDGDGSQENPYILKSGS